MWCHCGTMYNTLQNGTLGHNNVLPWFWEELLWHNHVQLRTRSPTHCSFTCWMHLAASPSPPSSRSTSGGHVRGLAALVMDAEIGNRPQRPPEYAPPSPPTASSPPPPPPPPPYSPLTASPKRFIPNVVSAGQTWSHLF